MKKILLILSIMIVNMCAMISFGEANNSWAIISSGAWVNPTIRHPRYRESRDSYDLYISSGVYLFVLNRGIQPVWNASGTSARQLQSQWSYDLVLNGGYFTYHRDTNSFQPAWRIVHHMRVIRSMVREFFHRNLDPNLAIAIKYDIWNNKVWLSRTDIIVPREWLYWFYAWPQLIQSGQIMSHVNARTSHRQRRAVRTFMIVDMDGQPHLGMTISGYTLSELARTIQQMRVFYGQYHVVNLDGWSSTSLAAGARYWNSRARLPWFFAVGR